MTTKGYGFLEYNSGDDSIIYSGSLADANNLGGMVLSGADSGSEVYANGGITVTKDLIITLAPSTAEKALLATGGHFSIFVDKTWIIDTYTAVTQQNQLFGGRDSGAIYLSVQKANNSVHIRMRDTGAAIISSNTRIQDANKNDFVEVTLSWIGTTLTCYVDKLPVNEIEGAIIDSDTFAKMFIGGQFSDSLQGFVVKNFHISTQPILLHVPYGCGHIAICGHSFSQGMDYPNSNSLISGDLSRGDVGDDTGLCQLHRRFASLGWGIPQGKIRNTGIGGVLLNSTITGNADTNTLNHLIDSGADFAPAATGGAQVGMFAHNTDASTQSRITNVTTTDLTLAEDIFPLGTEAYEIRTGFEGQIDVIQSYSTKPDVVIMQMGTNDAASAIPGTWQADYQVHIDRLVTAGARTILLINTITRNTNPTFAGSPYEGRVDELNVIHAALVAANPQCHLVDAFTLFGGHDNWLATDVNQSSSTHPNDSGYSKICEWTADVLMPLIAAL